MNVNVPAPDHVPSSLEEEAADAARLLKLMANEQRLMILCRLSAAGEMSVNGLVQAVGLGQSALSQHLAKLRADGIVRFRRDGTTLHYRLADARVATLLDTLRRLFCPGLESDVASHAPTVATDGHGPR